MEKLVSSPQEGLQPLTQRHSGTPCHPRFHISCHTLADTVLACSSVTHLQKRGSSSAHLTPLSVAVFNRLAKPMTWEDATVGWRLDVCEPISRMVVKMGAMLSMLAPSEASAWPPRSPLQMERKDANTQRDSCSRSCSQYKQCHTLHQVLARPTIDSDNGRLLHHPRHCCILPPRNTMHTWTAESSWPTAAISPGTKSLLRS